MNCKQGDLAVVRPPRTGGFCDWTGLLVEVISPLETIQHYPDLGNVEHVYPAEPGEWLCKIIGSEKRSVSSDPDVSMTSYGRMWDHRLKPFRDNPGTDETLTWAPVPSKVVA